MHPALACIAHRPWPLPRREWTWRQSWLDAAFIHHRVEARHLRGLVPPALEVQEFDGTAWVGLVPFRMAGVGRRPFPKLLKFPSFPELNLRTYVEAGGKPGVWFFSLDAGSWPIVLGGRHRYALPYYKSRMRQQFDGGWFHFTNHRRDGRTRWVGRYRGTGEVGVALSGTFERWAIERYCLYAATSGRGISRVQVHHAPWPLQRGEAVIEESSVFSSAGIVPVDDPPRVQFTSGVHVVSFPREAAG